MAGLLKDWRAVDVVTTVATNRELDDAPFLKVDPAWHWDYPQPDDDSGYLQSTYELATYCPECGVGAVQKAPFRLKSEPKWGKKSLLQINWVFDVYFVLPEVWRTVFDPFGVGAMPVLNHQTGAELKTVLQLTPQGNASADLELKDAPFEVCSKTGARKYQPICRGCFPSLKGPCDLHYFVSREYFGSGASANKAVIVSRLLGKRIREAKLKGVSFIPLAKQNV